MKIFFDALGCPKALVDAERMCYFLERDNHSLVSNPEEAEAVIINTCGFIEKAKKESIQTILQYVELKKIKPDLKIILSGCLTERYRNELLESLPEIDSAIGVRDPIKIIETLHTNSSMFDNKLLDTGDYLDNSFTNERKLYYSGLHYSYIKISEGCSRSCSFCAIPGIRGNQRSRKIEDIVKEAEFLASQGIEELILISEDTISYGTDIYKKKSLIELLKELVKLNFNWIRILYLFPDEEIIEIIRFMTSHRKICRYIDMPLQHVSKDILKSMKRPGNDQTYKKLINEIRDINPDLSIRTSFIVGYPGETEDDFACLREFIKTVRFDRVGFFEYSNEEGTGSFILNAQIPKKIIHKRIKELSLIQETISKERLKRFLGKPLLCINDGIIKNLKKSKFSVFRSEYDAPEIDGTVLALVNKNQNSDVFYTVKINEVFGNHDLIGKIISE